MWSPYLVKHIRTIEKVQRSFTKRLPGMRTLTYHQRLSLLNLDSLELRRLKADLILTYKIVSRQIVINNCIFIRSNCSITLRRHAYQIESSKLCKTSVRSSFYSYRIIRVWNALPITTDFPTLRRFTLIRFLKIFSSHIFQSILTNF